MSEHFTMLKESEGAMKKLALIQKELFVPKGQTNDFGKYNYRSCEDILVAVKPLLTKHNCTLMLSGDIEVKGIGDHTRFYYKAEALLTDLDTMTGVKVAGYAREEDTKKGMDGSQITGAAISYARKYALAGLFCIDNEKDSDATNKGDTKEKKSAKDEEPHDTVSALQINAIKKELERTGISLEKVLESVGKKKIETLTQKDYVEVTKRLNATPDRKE